MIAPQVGLWEVFDGCRNCSVHNARREAEHAIDIADARRMGIPVRKYPYGTCECMGCQMGHEREGIIEFGGVL